MAFTMPQQISTKSNNNANLSKLTKGIGEFYDEEKRIEIVLDENVNIILLYSDSLEFSKNSNQTVPNSTVPYFFLKITEYVRPYQTSYFSKFLICLIASNS